MEQIKASDLMIGNRLLYKDKIIEVAGISGASRAFGHQDITIYFPDRERCEMHSIKNLRPIPLTEDILLKAGFEKKDNGYPTDFIEWCEKEFPVIGILCQSSDKTYLFDEETDTLRIHYLHQLQNLFKSLTGNDLKIK